MTATDIVKLERRIVDDGADEIMAYIRKLPEHGQPLPRGIITIDCVTDKDVTRSKLKQLRSEINAYFGEPH